MNSAAFSGVRKPPREICIFRGSGTGSSFDSSSSITNSMTMSSSTPASSVTVFVTQGRMTGHTGSVVNTYAQGCSHELTGEVDFANVHLFRKLLWELGGLQGHFLLVLEPLLTQA